MGDVQKLFNPDHFRVKFRAGLAILGMLIGLVVILLLLLNETAQESTQADFIAGFVLATMIAGIMAYYFGNSDSGPISSPEIIENYITKILDKSRVGTSQ